MVSVTAPVEPLASMVWISVAPEVFMLPIVIAESPVRVSVSASTATRSIELAAMELMVIASMPARLTSAAPVTDASSIEAASAPPVAPLDPIVMFCVVSEIAREVPTGTLLTVVAAVEPGTHVSDTVSVTQIKCCCADAVMFTFSTPASD